MLLLAAAFLVAFVLLLYMVSPLISPKPLALPGAHVVVSGLSLLRRRRRRARSAAPSPPSPPQWRPGPRSRPGRRRPSLQKEGHLPPAPRYCPCEGSGDPPSAASGSSLRGWGQRQRAGSWGSRGSGASR